MEAKPFLSDGQQLLRLESTASSLAGRQLGQFCTGKTHTQKASMYYAYQYLTVTVVADYMEDTSYYYRYHIPSQNHSNKSTKIT